MKKALKQINAQNSEVDLSLLNDEQRQMVSSIIEEIQKEDKERSEK